MRLCLQTTGQQSRPGLATALSRIALATTRAWWLKSTVLVRPAASPTPSRSNSPTVGHRTNRYDPCREVPKTLAVEARCSALFSLRISLLVGVMAARVRLPLGTHTASSVKVSESGELIWAAGSYKSGVADVRSVAPRVHAVLRAPGYRPGGRSHER
jgi:hypothetical protein